MSMLETLTFARMRTHFLKQDVMIVGTDGERLTGGVLSAADGLGLWLEHVNFDTVFVPWSAVGYLRRSGRYDREEPTE